MLISYKRGQGSIVLRVKIRNSSVSTGAGLTGLTSGSSGLRIATIADNEATATAYTGANLETVTTLGTFAAPTSGKARFREVDSTNHPGIYEIQVADARFAVSAAKSVLISISGATNAAECDVLVPLTGVDPYDSAAGGMSRLDAAISSRLASGSYTAPLDAAAIRAAIGLALDNLDTQLAALAGYIDTEIAAILAAVDTEIAAIKAKTDNLPGDPADASDITAAFSTVNSTLSTIAAYVDTEVSAIKAKTDQMTFSVTGRIDATASGGDATAANQTTIINHLVAMKGGGFSGSTDSLEAISDAVAGLAVSSGSGAYTITITVNDGTTALQGATVRVTEGVTTITGTTNASGVVVFALDAANWALAITKPGYSYTPTTLTVSGTASFTRSMTAVSIVPPAGPGLSTGTIICYGTDGLPESGAKAYVRLVSGPGDAGAALDGGELTLTANGSGVATHTGFVRGGTYKARRGTSGTWVSFTVPDADSFDISELVGSP